MQPTPTCCDRTLASRKSPHRVHARESDRNGSPGMPMSLLRRRSQSAGLAGQNWVESVTGQSQ